MQCSACRSHCRQSCRLATFNPKSNYSSWAKNRLFEITLNICCPPILSVVIPTDYWFIQPATPSVRSLFKSHRILLVLTFIPISRLCVTVMSWRRAWPHSIGIQSAGSELKCGEEEKKRSYFISISSYILYFKFIYHVYFCQENLGFSSKTTFFCRGHALPSKLLDLLSGSVIIT